MRQESGESVANGRYEIGHVVGRGRRSRVHAARDRVLHRPVALKFLPSTDDGGTPRWQAEAAALNRFDHAHLVRLLDGGEVGSEAFLVLPLMTESLASRLDRGPLNRDHAVALVLALADALGHVHRAGLAHGEVDADGVLLDPHGRPCWGGLPDPSGDAEPGAMDQDLHALAVLAVRCVTGGDSGGAAPIAVLDAVRAASRSGRVAGLDRRLASSLDSIVVVPAGRVDPVGQVIRWARLRGRPGFAAALAAGFAASVVGAVVVDGGAYRDGVGAELGPAPAPVTVLADPAGSDIVSSVQGALNRLGVLASQPSPAPVETPEPTLVSVAEEDDASDRTPATERPAASAPTAAPTGSTEPKQPTADEPRSGDGASRRSTAQDDDHDGDDRKRHHRAAEDRGLVGGLLSDLL